jgi:cyclopropane-fatty-acyl-phospholipid synthase
VSLLDDRRVLDPVRWPDVAVVPDKRVRARIAGRLFRHVVRELPLHVVLPDGTVLGRGGDRDPVMSLLRPAAFYARLGASGLVGFGEAYMAGDWEADDLTDVLTVFAERVSTLVPPRLQRLRDVAVLSQPSHHRNLKHHARSNISHHYDLSNDLFALFLDPTMTYSSGLFDRAATLQESQERKIDRLLDAVGVTAGSEVLEIGTGWGELALRAARRGARVRSVTLSEEQRLMALDRVAAAGLTDLVQVDLCDYRDVSGSYDAVVSVEMIEAVGFEHWPTYFDVLARSLRPGGRIGLQAITMPYGQMLATRDTYTWIQKYIFPGGFCPSVEVIHERAGAAGLVVTDDLAFGQDNARTRHLWHEAFLSRVEAVDALGFDEVFRRMWSLYLSYSEAGFRSGYLDVHQLVLEHDDPQDGG